jgi:hypothetical protein
MIVRSEKTGKPVVRFILDDLKESGALPESIDFGPKVLETDFVCHGVDLAAVWDTYLWANQPNADNTQNESKVRPLRGGCSITTQRSFDSGSPSFGTLGCFVVDNEDDTICGLTNHHVAVQDAFLTKLPTDYVEPSENQTSSNIVGEYVYQGTESSFSTRETGSGYEPGQHIGVVKRYVPIGTFWASQDVSDEYANIYCGPNTYVEGLNVFPNSGFDKSKAVSICCDAALIAMDPSQAIDGWKQVGIEDTSFHSEYPEFVTRDEFWDIMYDSTWGHFETDQQYGDGSGRPDMIISGRTTGAKQSGKKLVASDSYDTDVNIVAPLVDFHLGYDSDTSADGRLSVMIRNSFAIGLQPSGASDLLESNPDSQKWIAEVTMPGDSGSAVFIKVGAKWKILGLVFAASKLPSIEEIINGFLTGQQIPWRIGICCPMYILAEQLNIRPWNGLTAGYKTADIENPQTIVLEGLTTRERVIHNGEVYHLAGSIPDSESSTQVVEIEYDISSHGGICQVIPNMELEPFPNQPAEEGNVCPDGYTYSADLNACVVNQCPEGYTYDPIKQECIAEEKALYLSAVSRESPALGSQKVNYENKIKIGKGKYKFQLGNNNIPRNTDKGYVITTDIPASKIVGIHIDPGSTITNTNVDGTNASHYSQTIQPIKNSFGYEGNTSANGIMRYSDNSIQVYPFFQEAEGANSDFSAQVVAVEIDSAFSTFEIGIPGRGYEPIKLEYDSTADQAASEAHFPSIETNSLLDVKPYCSAMKANNYEAYMIYPIYRFQDLVDKKLLHLAASSFKGWPSWEDLTYRIEQYRGYQIDDEFTYGSTKLSYADSSSYYELSIKSFGAIVAGLVINGKIGDHQFSYTVPSSPTQDTVLAGIASEINKGTNLTASYSLGGITITYSDDSLNLIGYQGNGTYTTNWKNQNSFDNPVKWLDPEISTSGISIGWLSSNTTSFNPNSVFDFRVMKPGNRNVLTSQQRFKDVRYHNSATLIPINALYNTNTVYGKKYGPYNPRGFKVNENGWTSSSISPIAPEWGGAIDTEGRTQFSNWSSNDGVFAEPINQLEVRNLRADPYEIAGTTKWSQVAYAQYYVLNPNWTEGWAAVRAKWNIPEDNTLTTPLWHKFFNFNFANNQDDLAIDAKINLDILPATSFTAYYTNNNSETVDDIKYSMVQNKV